METKKHNIGEFLENLSSASSTPGGGSASALTGSIAASLVSMVARLTLTKKEDQFVAVAAEMEDVVSKADQLRDQLLDLADQDTAAFDGVMAAYRLPKSTDEEKSSRSEKIQDALKHATEVPYHIAEACNDILMLVDVVANRGVRTAVSDAGTAAGLAEAALHSALLNVDINLKSIKDEKYLHIYHIKKEDLSKAAKIHKNAILVVVEDWINPEHE